MKTNTLYRFFSATGRLLYVGITLDPAARFRSHRRAKPWWPEVAEIKMQQFSTRAELEAAEREAIKEENPVWNVIYARKIVASSKQEQDYEKSDKPDWKCSVCGDRASGSMSFLSLPRLEMSKAIGLSQYMRSIKHYPLDGIGYVINTSALLEAPDEGQWQIYCAPCTRFTGDNEPMDDQAYSIRLNAIETWRQVVSKSLHLHEKSWFKYTNWTHIMRTVGARE